MVSSMMSAVVLVTLAACARAELAPRVLRERPQRVCGSAHFGSSSGASPQRLVVTHLTPGVADWNIAVPMPPMCKNARVTGVETSVCDADEPPDVSMHDLVSARVHRRGSLASYATVDVTVYCVLPPSTPAPATPAPATPAAPPATAAPPLVAYGAASAPGLQYGDARSSYEVLSNELISNEVVSGEVASSEVPSDGFTSNELVLKVVTPIPSVVTPPPVEISTPHIQLTSLVQSVDPPVQKESLQSNDLQSKSYEVTIKIRPPSYEPTEKGKTFTYEARLPMLPVKEEAQVEEDDRVPEILTPPRNSPILPPAAFGSTLEAFRPQPGAIQTGTYVPPPESRAPVRGSLAPQPSMHGPPLGTHGPPPGMHEPQSVMQGPPSGMQGPPSGMQGPPSGMQGPPPGMHRPPPGMHEPPPGVHGPPPGMQGPPPQGHVPYPGSFSPLYDALPPTLLVAPMMRPLRWLRPRLGLWPRQRSILLFPHL